MVSTVRMNAPSPTSDAELTSHIDPLGTDRRFAAALTIFGFAATCTCALIAGDAYYHLDDVTHFLYAKWAWHWPAYLLDDWGRPGFTVAYALPAALGWTACRLLSCGLTAAGAWFAYLTADRVGLRPAWPVIPLCFAQPLYFVLAQTTLTETPLAFYVSLALYLAVSNRWMFSAIVLSAAFVTRHEAIVFLPAWLWFAWRDKASWKAMALVFWAPLIVNVCAPLVGRSSLVSRLLDPTPTAQYGHGGWLTYFAKSMHAWGPAVMVLAMLGCGALWRRAQARIVVAALVIFFVAQTVVFKFGLFASGGYSRFLVSVSPLAAIPAWAGLKKLLSAESAGRYAASAAACMVLLWIAMERQRQLQHGLDFPFAEIHRAVWAVRISAGVLAALGSIAFIMMMSTSRSMRIIGRSAMPVGLAVLMAATGYVFLRPMKLPPDAKLMREAAAVIESKHLAERPIISAHPYCNYLTDTRISPDRPTTRRRIEQADIGTLVVWESRLAATEDHGLQLIEFTNSPAFSTIHRSAPLPYEKRPFVWVFEKRSAWKGHDGGP